MNRTAVPERSGSRPVHLGGEIRGTGPARDGRPLILPVWVRACRGGRSPSGARWPARPGWSPRARLRSPRFVRVFPDVYVTAGARPPDLALRSAAAYRLVEGRGVVSGYSAAALLGADCAPDPDVAAEVTVPGGGQRAHPGLRVRRDRLAPGETTDAGGVRCTSPLRTAFDLARQADLVEAVVAVDRLSNVHRFQPDLLLNFAVHYRGARGTNRVSDVLAHGLSLRRFADGDPAADADRAGRAPAAAGAVAGAGRRHPHGGVARPGLPRTHDRHRVRGRAARHAGAGAARRGPLHPAGRPRLAHLPLHQVRGAPGAGSDRRRAPRAPGSAPPNGRR